MSHNEEKELSSTERERIRRDKMDQDIAEHNAQIVPDIPRTIRIDGPSRQYRQYRIGGMLYSEEI